MTAPRRPIAGRLNAVHAPAGTILGPTDITREFLVVVDNDDDGAILGYASRAEIDAIAERDPQSVCEATLLKGITPDV